ncbi:MAG: helix-turn-helix transcriptional regulator [Bacteriovorax sp.]|nr:helix-turn-helix transcriptional regulator [Bacteriovorax sp.]
MKDPTMGKHSHNNRDSREGQILRFVREARKLSLKDVALKMDMKAIDIDHFENGRKFYGEADINKFLVCYDFKMTDFQEIMGFKILNKQMVNHFVTKI